MTDAFRDRVAIVTGAGGGLGRAYALALAARGARVLVNDPGCDVDGHGRSDAAARVVAEIIAAGGEAMADDGDVTDPDAMTAMARKAADRWGGIHILVNNAGIMRNRSFRAMVPRDFERVVAVHLFGSAYATHACWPWFREQRYGRVLMTTSSSGLFGRFPQPDYAAAKAGVVGLAKTLQLEGMRRNIRVNCIMPIAATRTTRAIIPDPAFDLFSTEHVVPAMLALVGEDTPGGLIVGAAAGVVQSANVTLTRGVHLRPEQLSPEGILAGWPAIADRAGDIVPQSGAKHAQMVTHQLKTASPCAKPDD